MYNLYDYSDYPKLIRIIDSNENYTKFSYIYNMGNSVYKAEIDIENLFKYFNALKPEMVISLKKVNQRLMLILNRYNGEDEDLHIDIGCIIDLLKTKIEKECFVEYIEYFNVDEYNSIKFKDEVLLKIRYVYYTDDIKTILNEFIMDHKLIEYILVPIYEFIGKLLHLFVIDNENAIKNILNLNNYGREFLLFISNKIIDFNTASISVYDYRYNLKQFIRQNNLILLKYDNIVYIIVFKEKPVFHRTEEETGFNNDEMSVFLMKKI